MNLVMKESRIAKLDFDGFEKELKGTLKERKKAHRGMSKDEVRMHFFTTAPETKDQILPSLPSFMLQVVMEKELFQQTQNERFEDNMKQLNDDHALRREKLDKDQQEQVDALVVYFDTVEKGLLGADPAQAQ